MVRGGLITRTPPRLAPSPGALAEKKHNRQDPHHACIQLNRVAHKYKIGNETRNVRLIAGQSPYARYALYSLHPRHPYRQNVGCDDSTAGVRCARGVCGWRGGPVGSPTGRSHLATRWASPAVLRITCGSTLHGAASGIGDAHAFAGCPAQAADDSRMRSAGSRVLLLKR